MPHPLKLRPFGSSLGVIIPKEVLNSLNVQKGDTLYLTEGADGFRVVAHDPAFAKTMKTARLIARRYRNALKDLSK